MQKTEALVLCGGAGTRFLPWSEKRHKCLVLVPNEDNGGEPLACRHYRQATVAGFTRVWFNVPRSWEEDFRRALSPHGKSWGILPEDGEPNGSGVTVQRLASFRPSVRKLAVFYGDTFLDSHWYQDMFIHTSSPASFGSIGTLFYSKHSPLEGGVVETMEGYSAVTYIDERPKTREGKKIHVGALVLPMDAVRANRKSAYDLMGDLVQRLISNGVQFRVSRLFGSAYSARDVGTPERYARFVLSRYMGENWDLFDGSPALLAVARAPRVYLAGNGGASSIAAHSALDWQKAGGLVAQHLGDPAQVTAISNDRDFQFSYSDQLRGAGTSDALVLFSVSGTSPNILKAAQTFRKASSGSIVGVTRLGSALAELSDHVVGVGKPERPSTSWGYGPPEDEMQKWSHAVAAFLEGVRPWRDSCG